MRSLLLFAAAVALAGAAAGCGEKATVTVYKQVHYQVKHDMQPWYNDQYKGEEGAWEKAVKARNLGQNEYVRISGG